MKKILFIFFYLTIQNFNLFAQGIGTQAPNFTHETLDHGQISLTDYAGKIVYLFFFGWG